MKKARVTADEKRVRAVEFLMEQKTLFNLKELESRLSKEKGIVSQAVQGLLDELVADNLIEKDKIGSGNFFWCFPSKAVTSREAKLTAQLQQADALTETIQGLQNRKRRTHEGREDTPERTAVLAQLAELKRKVATLDQGMAKYAANDPEKLKELQNAIKTSKESANRWTDNSMQLCKFYRDRMGEFKQEDFLKHFELPPDLDELA